MGSGVTRTHSPKTNSSSGSICCRCWGAVAGQLCWPAASGSPPPTASGRPPAAGLAAAGGSGQGE